MKLFLESGTSCAKAQTQKRETKEAADVGEGAGAVPGHLMKKQEQGSEVGWS